MNRPARLMRLARDGWDHRHWYEDAYPILEASAGTLRTSVNRLIDILAVTSPRCSVTRNVRVTIGYIRDRILPKDVIRTTRLALSHYEKTGEIRGPKTSMFAAALKGNGDAIVLDTWMARALGVDQRIFSTKRGRNVCERRIRYGAYVMGVTPAQFQAAVWSGTVLRAGKNRTVPRLDRALQESLA